MLITFGNGEVHETPFCVSVFDELQIILTDVNFVEAATLFTDTDKTGTIRTDGREYYGFTNLKTLYPHPAGGVCCHLVKKRD